MEEEDNTEPQLLPFVDYVLVYDGTDLSLATPRKLFESAMENEQLVLDRHIVGHLIFLKIYCPFSRMGREAERIRLEVPLKGCDIKPIEPNYCRRLQKMLTTDDEVDFVSAPFEVSKKNLFVGSGEDETIFRSSVRSFLVHHILLNLNINDKLKMECEPDEVSDLDVKLRKRGLLYLLMKNAYIDSFVIHEPSAEEPYFMHMKQKSLDDYYQQIPKLEDDPRRELNQQWTKFYKFQPLWKVRNYFGEKVAFYFAWQGTFLTLLWIPALFGLIIFSYGLLQSIEREEINYCDPIMPFETINTTTTAPPPLLLANSSVTNNNATQEARRCSLLQAAKMWSQTVLKLIKKSNDNIFSAFFAVIICLWGSLFLEVWKRNKNTHAYQWDCDTYKLAEPDRPEFFGTLKRPDPVTGELEWIFPQWKRIKKFIVSSLVVLTMIGIVFMSVCAVIAYKVIMRRKNNCPATNSDDEGRDNKIKCFIVVTTIPSLLNAISIMFLGRVYDVIARKLTYWENHRTESEFNDALIIKLFAFQFANTYTSLFYIAFFRPEAHGFQNNGVFGWGPDYKDTCARGTCMSLLSFQVLVLMLMKPFPKFFKDIILPWIKVRARRAKRRVKRKQTAVDQQTISMGIRTLRRDFIEREYYKPKVGDFTLGEYTEKVIQYGYIVMFAASFPLAPLLALVIGLVDIRIDAKRLLWFNRRPVGFIASDIGMWLPILRFVSFCGVVSNAFIVAYTSDFCHEFFKLAFDNASDYVCTPAQRMTIVIVFEHFVLTAMYVIGVSVPDVPSAIKLAQRRERYEVPKILEEGNKRTDSGRKTTSPDRKDSICLPSNSNLVDIDNKQQSIIDMDKSPSPLLESIDNYHKASNSSMSKWSHHSGPSNQITVGHSNDHNCTLPPIERVVHKAWQDE